MGPRRKDNDRRLKAAASAVGKSPVSSTAINKSQTSGLPLALQQLILNQFSRAFAFDSATELHTVIQTVKGHLYNRDFANAFGQPEHLEAYAVRWSAGRALGYADLLSSLASTLNFDTSSDNADLAPSHIICIGGGAGAELVALSVALARSQTESTTPAQSPLSLTLLDIADWSQPVLKLQRTLTTPPLLSEYASATARAANASLISQSSLDVSFLQHDVLTDWPEPLRNESLPQTDMVTIMFTLNELFTASIAKTTKLLLDLTERMKVGAWLLVVDSPGSYSEVQLGQKMNATAAAAESEKTAEGKTKQYPMKWLLEHALMEVAKGRWEKVLGEDSRWYRVPEGLVGKYEKETGVAVENMRYQWFLYRRTGSGR
jgi:25S rRNA (uracil2843-N3)-methyltransferase